MKETTRSVEERLQLLEDIQEINTLKARYCHACDGFRGGPTHDYEGVAACFTEDGVWDPTPLLPKAQGRQAIREMIRSHQTMPFAMHNAVNPVIEVAGDTPTGKFNVIVMVTSADRKAHWVFAHYEDQFVRTPDGWRIQYLRALVDVYASYETGWAAALSPPSENRHADLTTPSRETRTQNRPKWRGRWATPRFFWSRLTELHSPPCGVAANPESTSTIDGVDYLMSLDPVLDRCPNSYPTPHRLDYLAQLIHVCRH